LYCVWLFDPQKQRFVLAEEVSQIPNPQPDQQTKTIVSFVKENCAGGCFEQTSYAWAGGHLKPISYLGRALDLSAPPTSDCRFVRTMKQEKNGKLVETDRQRVDTGGNQCFEPRR